MKYLTHSAVEEIPPATPSQFRTCSGDWGGPSHHIRSQKMTDAPRNYNLASATRKHTRPTNAWPRSLVAGGRILSPPAAAAPSAAPPRQTTPRARKTARISRRRARAAAAIRSGLNWSSSRAIVRARSGSPPNQRYSMWMLRPSDIPTAGDCAGRPRGAVDLPDRLGQTALARRSAVSR